MHAGGPYRRRVTATRWPCLSSFTGNFPPCAVCRVVDEDGAAAFGVDGSLFRLNCTLPEPSQPASSSNATLDFQQGTTWPVGTAQVAPTALRAGRNNTPYSVQASYGVRVQAACCLTFNLRSQLTPSEACCRPSPPSHLLSRAPAAWAAASLSPFAAAASPPPQPTVPSSCWLAGGPVPWKPARPPPSPAAQRCKRALTQQMRSGRPCFSRPGSTLGGAA